jgi:hypothetical protein
MSYTPESDDPQSIIIALKGNSWGVKMIFMPSFGRLK